MQRLDGSPRHYAWGSRTAVPELLGVEPDGRPVAELWFGAHPAAPSMIRTDTGDLSPLDAVIAGAPTTAMGADVVARFGPCLPYLLKIIAAEHPLSLQVHPPITRARDGFAVEEAAGIPADDPRRNYKDCNHKPELVYALTRFEALCGFRAPRRAARLLAGLDVPLAESLRRTLTGGPPSQVVRSAFRQLLAPEQQARPEEIDAVAAACARRLAEGSPSPRADRTVVELAQEYPGDPGVVISLLLNRVTLEPGDAMFVPPGGVHAYLGGLAVEIMASSDNVLRAGLTAKHIDIPEVLANVDYVPAPPIRIAPESFRATTRVFSAPVDDFELSVTTVAGWRPQRLPGVGPRIVLCLDGEVTVGSTGDASMTLARGQAVFVPAGDGFLEVSGRGTVVQADVP